MLWLQIANIAFFIFHTILIVFNVIGWGWKRTRIYNLITLGMTAFSWLVMGIWKGVGYCICTDWHWRIREAMGIHETSSSYLVLLVRSLTGWDPPVSLVNPIALIVFVGSICASVYLNIKDRSAIQTVASAT